MRLTVIHGLIRRRLLVNFRVDAGVMGRFLPAPFRPKLHVGYAVAGICLIRLEEIRPAWLPRFCGLTSENAAHRIAVVWNGPDREKCEGVFVSSFFEGGSLGYSVTSDCCRYDGIRLQTEGWRVRPFAVEHVHSSFFADETVFPAGSVSFDHGLVMRDLSHRWIGADDLLIAATDARIGQPSNVG